MASKFNDMAVSKRLLIFFVLIFMPRMFRFLNLSFLNPESTKELLKILTAAKAERRSTKSKYVNAFYNPISKAIPISKTTIYRI